MLQMDMHVHTCLSPCAELEMHPSALVCAAKAKGLDGFVVSDHNSARNVIFVQRAGEEAGIGVLAGMEVTTAEEVHIQAILPGAQDALALGERIYEALPGENDPEHMGLQVIANEEGEVLGFDEHFLSGATTLSLERVVEEIHKVGGLAVAAHADRECFGIVGQLGFIPSDVALDAVEVSTHSSIYAMRRLLPRSLPVLRGSDAHRLSELGHAVTFFYAGGASFGEVKQALENVGGRTVLGGGKPMEEISMHILDIAQNAVEAGAKRIEIELVEDTEKDLMTVEVRDDGRGMSPEVLRRAVDPFYTTRKSRRVGLGLSLLKAAAEASGGGLEIWSEIGKGTKVRATFRLSHVDRAPLGDLETTLLVLTVGSPDVAVWFRHSAGGSEWVLDTDELRTRLGGAPLSSPDVITLLRNTIREGEDRLAERRVRPI